MAAISQKANLSKRYTNHKIKGTTATVMKNAGHSLDEIATVTHHKNLESLKCYLAKPTLEDKVNFSKTLSKFGQSDKCDKVESTTQNK